MCREKEGEKAEAMWSQDAKPRHRQKSSRRPQKLMTQSSKFADRKSCGHNSEASRSRSRDDLGKPEIIEEATTKIRAEQSNVPSSIFMKDDSDDTKLRIVWRYAKHRQHCSPQTQRRHQHRGMLMLSTTEV
ncbi:hypothetical protein B9Z55_010952 [Caenorhabditis nigoni]|uniref:Uncharacterized protein n=1 Tax=Caenorhabditis nigoni TaxID=1611254 RepID=A0A2G5UIZ9_9PELO|nr:hypothetical protein B9Z55_010952 [Caenorhabditis nigoni]